MDVATAMFRRFSRVSPVCASRLGNCNKIHAKFSEIVSKAQEKSILVWPQMQARGKKLLRMRIQEVRKPCRHRYFDIRPSLTASCHEESTHTHIHMDPWISIDAGRENEWYPKVTETLCKAP